MRRMGYVTYELFNTEWLVRAAKVGVELDRITLPSSLDDVDVRRVALHMAVNCEIEDAKVFRLRRGVVQ